MTSGDLAPDAEKHDRTSTVARTPSRTRVAVGVGLTAATGAMTAVATQTGGTFWAAHAWVAWTLLGLLVAALAVNELPRLLSRNLWLAVLTALGLALSLALWISVRSGVPLPLDGSDPGSLTSDGTWPQDKNDTADELFYLSGREIGDVHVYVSERYQIVWGAYRVRATTDLPEIDVHITVTRSTDGTSMPAAPYPITPAARPDVAGVWTPTLAYAAAACYLVTATLDAGGRGLGTVTTVWCGPRHR